MITFDTTTLIGLIAATCTTISFLPQVIRVIISKQTRDISLSMYVILSSGVFLWLVYGILKDDMPIITANGITFALSSTILFFKIRYK